MRILFASERPPYPFFLGGAARCAHQLLRTMTAELGVECTAVGSADYATTPWSFPATSEFESLGIVRTSPSPDGGGRVECGYDIHLLPDFFPSLERFIDGFRPDVVWAQLEGSERILDVARRKGVQGLYFVHDAEFEPAALRAIARSDCHLVCSSDFLADKTRETVRRPAHTVHPPMELYFDTLGDPDGSLTMINPFKVKGVDTLFEIAARLPEERFLLQESWRLNDAAGATLRGRLDDAPNVRFQRRVADMRQVYGQTKLLLVPSVWEEGFGMVAVEAQSCRIPVIASARGGLPESVGDGGILIEDYRNSNAWIAAIRQIIDEPANYRAFSDRAHRRAASGDFSPSAAARRFRDVCMAPAPRTPWRVRALDHLTRHLTRPAPGRRARSHRGT